MQTTMRELFCFAMQFRYCSNDFNTVHLGSWPKVLTQMSVSWFTVSCQSNNTCTTSNTICSQCLMAVLLNSMQFVNADKLWSTPFDIDVVLQVWAHQFKWKWTWIGDKWCVWQCFRVIADVELQWSSVQQASRWWTFHMQMMKRTDSLLSEICEMFLFEGHQVWMKWMMNVEFRCDVSWLNFPNDSMTCPSTSTMMTFSRNVVPCS